VRPEEKVPDNSRNSAQAAGSADQGKRSADPLASPGSEFLRRRSEWHHPRPDGLVHVDLGLDPRLAIICNIAAPIFAEERVFRPDRHARDFAIDQAFLLYGEIERRLREATE
jgi:hypothetical protein